MKGKKIVLCIVCLRVVVIGGIIAWTFYNHNGKTGNKVIHKSNDLIQYLETYWEIELEDYAEDAEGEVEMYDDDEDRGVIKVKVQMEYEETVLVLHPASSQTITGYSLANLVRASCVLNCHLIFTLSALRLTVHIRTCCLKLSKSGHGFPNAWRLMIPISISAMSSQLPCFGV